MPTSVEQTPKERLESDIAVALRAIFFRMADQSAFTLLRSSGRKIVLAENTEEISGRALRFVYVVYGEGLLVITYFPNGTASRWPMGTKDMAKAIVRANPPLTVESLKTSILQELENISVKNFV